MKRIELTEKGVKLCLKLESYLCHAEHPDKAGKCILLIKGVEIPLETDQSYDEINTLINEQYYQ